jgi:hypothetical protein
MAADTAAGAQSNLRAHGQQQQEGACKQRGEDTQGEVLSIRVSLRNA